MERLADTSATKVTLPFVEELLQDARRLLGTDFWSYGFAANRHVLETFAFNAQICLHLRLLAGRDPHHIVEAQFKALARALRDAVALDPRVEGVPSTKGAL